LTKLYSLFFCIGCLASFNLFGQGIKGTVKSDTGEPLAFTTIFVKELGTGTTTNAEAYYEIRTEPGTYTVVFQFVGYESQEISVIVGKGFSVVDITLNTQTMLLKDVVVNAGKEDPAYTIMRKAIAKSKYHLQQLDSFTAQVYMKGTGQLTDAPFLFRGRLEKEGIKEGRVFITESVSEIEYIRPNTYNEKVISIYSTGDDNNSNPNAYVNGSFYEPELANSISPLSPKAFSYYRFIYDGTYKDRGFEVSKIRVIPRSRGDNVFEGYIEIVEDYWSIHSLDLKVGKLGIDFRVKQIYQPIEDKVWLPVTHEFEVKGKVLGFGFEANYRATVSNYKITLNPDLDVEFEVIDEKVEKELAQNLEKKFNKQETSELQELLSSGEEVTRKQLNKVIKAYEKAEIKGLEAPEVISRTNFKIDTLANNRDSTYWAAIRPVPLTAKEIEGYHIVDSIAQVERAERGGDTLVTKRNRKGFKLQHILIGGNYKLKEKTYFEIHFPDIEYNTVDGYNVDYRLSFRKTFENGNWIKLGPTARYAFSREKFSGFFSTQYGFGDQDRRSDVEVKVGRYINQFNNEEPIHPLINSFMTFFLERNYMKIYEKDFVSLTYKKKLSEKVNLKISGQVAERRELFNTTTSRLYDRKGDGFTENAPTNIDPPDTSFPNHNAVTSSITLTYQPWVKYRIRNGRKNLVEGSSPIFDLLYSKGIPDIADSKVDFDFVEAGIAYKFKIGVRGFVDFKIKAGSFLNDKSMYFMDYKHFLGNRTPFTTVDPVGSFRLLDYYTYSTSKNYFQSSVHYQFRKFLLTRIPIVRLANIRESFFVNYLANDHTNSYTEVGYGINYILRIFRIEAVTSFEGGEYRDFGVRIGIAANLNKIF
jgi:hypothetical protein